MIKMEAENDRNNIDSPGIDKADKTSICYALTYQ